MPRDASVQPVLHLPAGSRLQPSAPISQLKLAVGRAIISKFTSRSDWSELALITDTEDVINGHGRLLRSLSFGDEDYDACVHDVVPDLLGLREERRKPDDYVPDAWGSAWDGAGPLHVFVDKLPELEEHLQLPDWLADHEPRLHRLLYAPDLAAAAALEAVGDIAVELSLPEIVRQLERLQRDLAGDLPAAIAHAKELVESACKNVLGQTGAGAGERGPRLIDAALRRAGRHPSQVDASDPDVQLVKQLLGAVAGQLQAVFGLRNRVGTGHGRAGEVALDEPLARLTIASALNAVTYLLQVSDLTGDTA